MRFILILFFIIVTSQNAKILEVSQVFNTKLVKVKTEQISEVKSFYGAVALDESKTYDIVTRFDGYITKLYANEQYKTIKKGEKLFNIYSDEINTIQQELKVSKAFDGLFVDSSIQKLKSLDLNSSIIENIRKSNIIMSDIPFYSPINSIVLQKNINQGSFAKKGKLLLQLASLDELWLLASVYQKDLAFIEKNMKAKIYIDGVNDPIDSKVDMIYPTVDPKTKSVNIRLLIPNKELRYYPNMFAKVVLKKVSKEMLILPRTAVLKKGNKHYVFQKLSKSEIEPIEISAKRVSSHKYEILEGLKEGQEVINNALFLLDSDAITNGLYSSDDDDW